jgi:hypothetical protein
MLVVLLLNIYYFIKGNYDEYNAKFINWLCVDLRSDSNCILNCYVVFITQVVERATWQERIWKKLGKIRKIQIFQNILLHIIIIYKSSNIQYLFTLSTSSLPVSTSYFIFEFCFIFIAQIINNLLHTFFFFLLTNNISSPSSSII